jgi:DNA-binding CsgD family transcriptional regulator
MVSLVLTEKAAARAGNLNYPPIRGRSQYSLRHIFHCGPWDRRFLRVTAGDSPIPSLGPCVPGTGPLNPRALRIVIWGMTSTTRPAKRVSRTQAFHNLPQLVKYSLWGAAGMIVAYRLPMLRHMGFPYWAPAALFAFTLLVLTTALIIYRVRGVQGEFATELDFYVQLLLALALAGILVPAMSKQFMSFLWFLPTYAVCYLNFAYFDRSVVPWVTRLSPVATYLVHCAIWYNAKKSFWLPAEAGFSLMMIAFFCYVSKLFATIVLERGYEAAPEESQVAFGTSFGLSGREREVLQLLLQGYSTKEIGETLFISAGTAKLHVQSIYRKTGANSRFKLLSLFNRQAR